MSAVAAHVLDAAIAWQLCLDSGTATASERQAFATWLAADAEHVRVWQQLGGLDQQLASANHAAARHALLHRAAVRQQRTRLGGGVFSLLLIGTLALGLQQQRPLTDYLADAMTASGEQRDLNLADRSLVRLNSHSAVDIDFTGSERRLYLRSGEILVQTAHGDPRPFVVDTPQGRLRALGTRFLVRREGAATRLIVLQAAVAAQPLANPGEQVINAGEQVLMQADGLGQPASAPSGADAWSRGMLVVENQRLGDLLATLGEYRHGYLGVDPSIADLRISGSFPLHDSDRALAALPPSLPVRIERHTGWWVRVVPQQAPAN